MPELKVNPALQDKSPAFADKASHDAAMTCVDKMLSSLSFFKTLMQTQPQKSDVFTHLSLLEYGLADLSKTAGYDGIIAGQVEERHAEIRAANLEIRRLTELMGNTMSGHAVAAGLRRHENLFRAWYEACGFKYGEIEFHEAGIWVDMGFEINNQPAETPHLCDKDAYFAAIKSEKIQSMFIYNAGYDLEKDRYRSYLLDTDKNKENIKRLYAATFPGAHISGFSSHSSENKYLLRHKAIIPYPDISDWAETLKK